MLSPALQALLGPPGWVRALSPGATPSLALDFANNRYWNGQVRGAPEAVPGWSFSRTGVEYEATSSGLLVPFASGVPAITDLGLQVWEARTNNVLSSQAIGDARWSTIGSVTPTLNAAPAPDGTTTATRLSFAANGSTARVTQAPASGTGAQAYSIWVRGHNGQSGSIDLQTQVSSGVDTMTTINFTGTWQRFSVLYTATGSGGTLGIRNNTTSAVDIDVWGAQLEAASSVGPYIQTTGASATRGAVSASITFSGSPATAQIVYGSGAGTTATISNPTSPLNLGASSGGAWVNNIIQRVILK